MEAVASSRDWSVPVEAPSQMWSLHVGNAFKEDNGRGGLDLHLHMSGCSYDWFHFHTMFGNVVDMAPNIQLIFVCAMMIQ